MSLILDYHTLCRLCLVKEHVDNSIFNESNKNNIYDKIKYTLPIQIAENDNLPKKICENCSQKLDSLYDFINTALNAEKQLFLWFKELELDTNLPESDKDGHNVIPKQETNDEQNCEQIFTTEYLFNNNNQEKTKENDQKDRPTRVLNQPKKRGRPPGKRNTRSKSKNKICEDEISGDENSVENVVKQDEDFEMVEQGDRVAKEETQSDDDFEPTDFVEAQNDQPGPSGLSKNVQDERSTKDSIFFDWENSENDFQNITIKVEPIDFPDLTDVKSRKNRKISCVVCKTILRKKNDLLEHYTTHKQQKLRENLELIAKTPENPFSKCRICLKEFSDSKTYVKHERLHSIKPYFCVICLKSFKQGQNFLNHMNFHEFSSLFICDLCPFKTTAQIALEKHRKSHNKVRYSCDKCNKIFPAKTWYLEHQNFHNGTKPFRCDLCAKEFYYSRYLKAHVKSMHQYSLNKCGTCGKTYAHKNSLRLHMRIHSGENSFLCDTCGKSLSSRDKLQLHKRIHTGYKPYVCHICPKKFTKKDILTDHLRVHSGEKPFECDVCGKRFSQRSPLTIHKRYHTGERPYTCHLCNKGFVSKGILDIHLKQGRH